jgi:hypothetical protein
MLKRYMSLLVAVCALTGLSASVSAAHPIAPSFNSTPTGFGFHNFEALLSEAQAGSHPDLTVAFELNSALKLEEVKKGIIKPIIVPAGGEIRNLSGNLPPGLVGNPTAVPQCTRQRLDEEYDGAGCPADTQVGVDTVYLGGGSETPVTIPNIPVFNIVPPPGVPAEFSLNIAGIETFIDAGVRSGGDYGITAHTDNIVQRAIISNRVVVWGVPADPSHDSLRCVIIKLAEHCGVPSTAPLAPFLTLPTSCSGPLKVTADASTWEEPGATVKAETELPAMTGCARLVHFDPSITATPDTSEADMPAGLTVHVRAPQGLNPEGLAMSNIKDTKVVLPEGLVINPGQAAGLVACQPSQEGLGSETDEGPPSCPPASKVGTVEIETPLLKDTLKGNVYVLQSNPPNLQLLVAVSADGVNLKLIGNVQLDPATGRLTTTFDGNPPNFQGTPDLPFTEFRLSFSGGTQAALATPTTCGVFETKADFTPWNTPFIPDVFPTDSFAIDSGPGGSPCVSPLPFTPSMIAGSTTDQAGGFTNFSLLLQNADDQQRIGSLRFKLPEGLSGMISRVPLCPEPRAEQGECSAASQIGHAVVASGPGPYPLVIPEPGQPPTAVYLTGPYGGAPFGLSIVTPVIAGPFNLGTNVVRAKIEVDPHTAQIAVTTDPSGSHAIPPILDGVPTDLRTINTVIDRPGFMFNPTNCSPMSFSGTATSTQGASAPISSAFQVGSCRSLTFKPDFKVSTSSKTSRANGASLDAKIVYPTAPPGNNQASSQSNIASAKVELPKQLPSRLTTLQKACTAATFNANPAGCPAASVIGHATAITPVLPVPVTGPAYFVSHGGEAFPSLIVVLQGYGVTVDLVGTTFISKRGITSTTFGTAPDVPISSFELTLPTGPFSALAANGNLCKSKLAMPTTFVAQNGAETHQSTRVAVVGCPKAKKASKKHKGKKTSGKNKRK